jgi:uncharacterized membrane-anchored protein YitT (DUF2179 family)
MFNVPFFNFSFRKVGGLTFIKVARLTLSFSVAREFRPIGAPLYPRDGAR